MPAELAAGDLARIREPNVFIVDDVAFIHPEDGFAIGRPDEVQKGPGKAPAPAAHLQFISIAVRCEERRRGTGGQGHRAILRRPSPVWNVTYPEPGDLMRQYR